MKEFKGKNCLITGAASGIGRSFAIALANEGMNLFITDINMEGLEKVKNEIEKVGVKVHAGKCDVSKCEDFEDMAKEFYSKLGDVDLLINNAGIAIALIMPKKGEPYIVLLIIVASRFGSIIQNL